LPGLQRPRALPHPAEQPRPVPGQQTSIPGHWSQIYMLVCHNWWACATTTQGWALGGECLAAHLHVCCRRSETDYGFASTNRFLMKLNLLPRRGSAEQVIHFLQRIPLCLVIFICTRLEWANAKVDPRSKTIHVSRGGLFQMPRQVSVSNFSKVLPSVEPPPHVRSIVGLESRELSFTKFGPP
jgi:hypothetical protein